ncbi:uncharacterized protein TNCV_3413251 [Trichonephila clavipes]|uniref:SCAN box domain-containing protein n=1 Tax=Trichonephila clavipes TaxID=2585209 RepID=A0A8X6V494_TRICX|nr:uncharacterized protein TNCV_3413251 [Trichonephila clavipes]
MMAFLLKQTKVLLEVAIDLGVEVNSTLTKSEIKNRICQSEYYNEESVKSLLEGILAEKRELKENRETREFEERKLIRAFELERMKLANSTDMISEASTDLEGQGVNRRAGKKRKVAEDRWVSQLIPLLPMEIAEIVAKEPLEKSDDYPHIKNLLLARFQLTPIALRDRFESHQRRPGAMWADLVFELRSYLDNWLAGMKVDDFAALKELLVTEQIKKRAPSELVDHFLDSWDGFKEAKSLAEKLDHFEAIRRVHKKTGPTKIWERRTFDKQPLESKNKSAHFSATRGLLATDHVILNHGQVTWTTPELAPPLLTTTPHQREDVSALDRFNVHRRPTRRVFSGTGLEPVTKQATVRYLYHSATAAPAFEGEGGEEFGESEWC